MYSTNLESQTVKYEAQVHRRKTLKSSELTDSDTVTDF